MSHVFISDRRLSRETIRKRDDDDDSTVVCFVADLTPSEFNFVRCERKESHSRKETIDLIDLIKIRKYAPSRENEGAPYRFFDARLET
jgi:hypothetical protein